MSDGILIRWAWLRAGAASAIVFCLAAAAELFGSAVAGTPPKPLVVGGMCVWAYWLGRLRWWL